jgi:hypothetical protein
MRCTGRWTAEPASAGPAPEPLPGSPADESSPPAVERVPVSPPPAYATASEPGRFFQPVRCRRGAVVVLIPVMWVTRPAHPFAGCRQPPSRPCRRSRPCGCKDLAGRGGRSAGTLVHASAEAIAAGQHRRYEPRKTCPRRECDVADTRCALSKPLTYGASRVILPTRRENKRVGNCDSEVVVPLDSGGPTGYTASLRCLLTDP